MRSFLCFLVPVLLVGCTAFTNPDPVTRDQVRQAVHDGLEGAATAVTAVGGATGQPLIGLIGTGLGILATAFVAKSQTTTNAETIRQQSANHAETVRKISGVKDTAKA